MTIITLRVKTIAFAIRSIVLYNKQHDNLTKNDHFQALISTPYDRGFCPECDVFDSWYSSIKHLKTIRRYEWHWLTQLKSNRQVNLDKRGNQPVCELPISDKDSIVHLAVESASSVMSMDGVGRAIDTVYNERCWRNVKY